MHGQTNKWHTLQRSSQIKKCIFQQHAVQIQLPYRVIYLTKLTQCLYISSAAVVRNTAIHIGRFRVLCVCVCHMTEPFCVLRGCENADVSHAVWLNAWGAQGHRGPWQLELRDSDGARLSSHSGTRDRGDNTLRGNWQTKRTARVFPRHTDKRI